MEKNYLKITALILISALIGLSSCQKEGCTDSEATNFDSKAKKDDGTCVYDTTSDEHNITDDGSGVGTTTWKSGETYILEGLVFVNDGQVLTIEPGTIIKGKDGQGEDASALIVARGGKIMAEGTADDPIIFTAESDDLNGSLSITDRGLWGGLIILGKAQLNSTPGESAIEGIPTNETRGIYGGTDDTDDSGILKYISIRHGGTDIGEGNEINGLTLGGVGSGTTLEYIEVIANKDDGIEFFGGTPQIKYVVVSNCGDDSFDYDEGFRGKGQFWLAVQDENAGDRCGEHDGGTDPETASPYATPEIYNVTYIGRGTGQGSRILTFRDNAGGTYANSIFVNQEKGIDIELLEGEGTYDRFQAGELNLEGNVFYNVADGTAESIFKISFGGGASANPDSANAASTFAAYFTTANNSVENPEIDSVDPIPANPQTDNLATYPSSLFFETVSYKGAFDSENWAEGWTLLY
ncbi:MAG TPA: hypothetical protein DDX39_10475 [Bacteroidales bacterium]|nr:MAG: hypothetical protein A2W98_04000 [Bacteroidetes bacterium GWF2_33_38]OFY73603.1 MAG: hypothetical protein A2265_00680 [Bacteroidetes bacterium RIFOXYA12_FULL_33_9]OFY92410.1 MAG: hypothetical protein A2236_05765 [Bacteroidetes bacterium RIFOXYA2_FULL_33_7]HBF89055.1 hypothetical protein [Bacteroidales bacterium]